MTVPDRPPLTVERRAAIEEHLELGSWRDSEFDCVRSCDIFARDIHDLLSEIDRLDAKIDALVASDTSGR